MQRRKARRSRCRTRERPTRYSIRSFSGPDLHYIVDDLELRDECVKVIRDNQLPFAAYDDGVLVLCEVA